jgi:Flp pilus assembly protein TadB
VMVAVFMFIMPENYARFFRDPLGLQMIGVAVLLQITGILVMRKIVNIEY